MRPIPQANPGQLGAALPTVARSYHLGIYVSQVRPQQSSNYDPPRKMVKGTIGGNNSNSSTVENIINASPLLARIHSPSLSNDEASQSALSRAIRAEQDLLVDKHRAVRATLHWSTRAEPTSSVCFRAYKLRRALGRSKASSVAWGFGSARQNRPIAQPFLGVAAAMAPAAAKDAVN
jgi:hypothetical protein